ncbi:hypothetical protein O6R05_02190 [Peptoniphilus equinus]|uniref:Uncharacterized protein n=1 Tax=Peptoniphilus equinus TaxID=3016343 RepID=A0ABY7QUA8_9FIRM|nr:hypothetical protein [Peptoniphilus equinus]WBW50374.1 hypothetical protein O6R05_02190 [Peptoniphilus equinus]
MSDYSNIIIAVVMWVAILFVNVSLDKKKKAKQQEYQKLVDEMATESKRHRQAMAEEERRIRLERDKLKEEKAYLQAMDKERWGSTGGAAPLVTEVKRSSMSQSEYAAPHKFDAPMPTVKTVPTRTADALRQKKEAVQTAVASKTTGTGKSFMEELLYELKADPETKKVGDALEKWGGHFFKSLRPHLSPKDQAKLDEKLRPSKSDDAKLFAESEVATEDVKLFPDERERYGHVKEAALLKIKRDQAEREAYELKRAAEQGEEAAVSLVTAAVGTSAVTGRGVLKGLDPQGIQYAVVLKEILDKPLAMRER